MEARIDHDVTATTLTVMWRAAADWRGGRYAAAYTDPASVYEGALYRVEAHSAQSDAGTARPAVTHWTTLDEAMSAARAALADETYDTDDARRTLRAVVSPARAETASVDLRDESIAAELGAVAGMLARGVPVRYDGGERQAIYARHALAALDAAAIPAALWPAADAMRAAMRAISGESV